MPEPMRAQATQLFVTWEAQHWMQVTVSTRSTLFEMGRLLSKGAGWLGILVVAERDQKTGSQRRYRCIYLAQSYPHPCLASQLCLSCRPLSRASPARHRASTPTASLSWHISVRSSAGPVLTPRVEGSAVYRIRRTACYLKARLQCCRRVLRSSALPPGPLHLHPRCTTPCCQTELLPSHP